MGKGKKIGLGCLSILGILVIIFAVLYMISNESRPSGKTGAEADQLASDMLVAVNKPAWDSLHYVQWTFSGRSNYIWDKRDNNAVIQWQDNRVIMDLDEVIGVAFQGNNVVDGEGKAELIHAAWKNWCNDSFWLGAHYKVFDPGTQRSIVDVDGGKKGLLVDYTGGGTTPGDAYLWVLDENNKPEYWKMWVSIIPIGGVKTTWENWKELNGGATIAQKHMLGPMDISITNVHAGQSLDDLQVEGNPFMFN